MEVRFQERPQVPRLPTMSPESLDADLPAMDVDPPSEAAVVSADSSSDAGSAYEPPAAGFGSATDLALAELYSKHPDIGKGVFDSIIRITKLGPSSLPSGREFFKKVDAFPGMYVCITFYFLWFVDSAQMQDWSLPQARPHAEIKNTRFGFATCVALLDCCCNASGRSWRSPQFGPQNLRCPSQHYGMARYTRITCASL